MNIEKLRPLADFVLIQRDPPKDKTESGLYIPDNAKEKLTIGTVLAVGPGKVLDSGRRCEPTVKKGDKVVFGKYSGNAIEERKVGDETLLMREDDIYGVLEDA